jgi:hypothetical protein
MKLQIYISLLLLFLLIPISSAVTDSEAVLIFHFDEGLGTIAHDSSGNGNDGIIYGATWDNEIAGSALRFDGVSDWVESSLNAPITGDLTIISWVKYLLTPSHQQRILDLAPINNMGFQICRFTDGRVLIDNSGGPSTEAWSEFSLNDGKWHQIAGVRNGNSYKLYIDGKYESATSGSIPEYVRLFLGKRAEESFRDDFSGLIDEVKIYPRALSASEIVSIYNEGRSTKTPTTTPTTPTPPSITTIPTLATNSPTPTPTPTWLDNLLNGIDNWLDKWSNFIPLLLLIVAIITLIVGPGIIRQISDFFKRDKK